MKSFVIMFLINLYFFSSGLLYAELCNPDQIDLTQLAVENGKNIQCKTINRAKLYSCFLDKNYVGVLEKNRFYFVIKYGYKIPYNNKYWSLLAESNNKNKLRDPDKNVLGWVPHTYLQFNEGQARFVPTKSREIKNSTIENHASPAPPPPQEIKITNNNQCCIIGQSNSSFQKDIDFKTDIQAWVMTDKSPIYNCYKNGNIIGRLQLRKRYRILAGNYRIRYKKKKWDLLVTGENSPDIIGWVDHNALLLNRQPMKNEYTSISEKVLIKNGDANEGKALSVYKDQNLLDKEAGGIEVRTVFYVYDFYPHVAGEPSSPDTKSLLISPDSVLPIYKDSAPLLIGWINRKNVTFWNSRIACETPVGSSLEVEGDNGRILKLDTVKKPLSYKSLRNPILSEDGGFYRIGIFGELSRNQVLIRNSLDDIQIGLEVLFVIDGTRSMTKPFKKSLQGVKRIAKSLKSKAKINNLEQPRFGLLFYRDVQTIPPVKKIGNKLVEAKEDYCTKEKVIYRMRHIDDFIDKLDNQVACDSDKTAPESMYKGIVEGINECGFLKGKNGEPQRVRLLIHIGDAGDNGSGNYSPEDVAAIIRKNSIYKYIAIDVSNRGRGFSKSILPVVNLLGEDSAELKTHLSNLTFEVKKTLSSFQKETEKLDDQIKIISRGFAGTHEGRVGVISKKVLDYSKKIIKGHSIGIDEYDAFQTYFEGKVRKSVNLKKYLLVTRTDIEEITSFLNSLATTTDLKNKKDTWDAFLKIILGDETCVDNGREISIEKCNKMRNGIPIKAGFMKHSRESFLNMNTSETKETICEAKKVREKFRYLVADKKIKAILMDDEDACIFDPIEDLDINGDGLIVRGKNVLDEDGKAIRNASEYDLEDKYFFKESDEDVAWIHLDHLNSELEDN